MNKIILKTWGGGDINMSKKMIGSGFSGVEVELMESKGLKRLSTTKEDRERIEEGIKRITPRVEAGIKRVREWVKKSGEATEWHPGCKAM
ncbi:MAG: hypothetical protein AB1422_17795 [bacterium]